MNKFLAIVAFLVASLAVSEAVKCYQCESVTDPKCGDPFTANANQSKDCTDAITGCSKSKTTAAGKTVITRTCGAAGADADCNSASLLGIDTESCTCSGENCNTAGFAKVSLVMLIATVGLSFTFLQ